MSLRRTTTPDAAGTRPDALRRGTGVPAWLLAFWLVLALGVSSVGCRQSGEIPARSSAAAGKEIAKSASASNELLTDDREDGEHPGGSAPAAPPSAPGEGDESDLAADDEDAEDEDADHWKGVQFDVHNFDEVLDYVATYYIDAAADRKRAWIEAANFALMSLEPSAELLPVSFYQKRTGTPDEEGRLDGKTEPFSCRNQVLPELVMHHLPSDEYLKEKRTLKKKGRLSNEEVQVLRDKQKLRSGLYNEAWKTVAFGRPQFDCAITYVARRVEQFKTEAARAEAAKAKGPAPTAEAPKAEEKPTAKAAEARPATRVADAKGKAAPPAAKATPAAEPDKPRPPPDMNRAWVAAASGYLYALDPHSSVIPRKAWDESTRQTQDNSFEGIGAVLTQRDDMTIVENPMEGRPAWRAGVRAGDIIHKVDGVDVSGWMLPKVVKLIRGPKATRVVLTISREEDPQPRDVPIMRENIEIKNVDGNLLKDHPGIAHVKMTGFIPKSTSDLRDMIEKLRKQAPGGQLKGLVLDLRNNSGGLLNKAIEIADMFLQDGRIVSVRSRRRAEEVHDATPASSDYKLPLVVLVNDSSASASEIVASAIQDNKRGLVIGLRTFGKASVQTLFEPALHQDYYIKLTVARYYAPNGTTIQVVGVHPDVEVVPEVDGKMPVGFREENLNNHLIPIEGAAKSPWLPQVPQLSKCVLESGIAEKVARREPKPQIHPDFQLLRGADYVNCLARMQEQAAGR